MAEVTPVPAASVLVLRDVLEETATGDQKPAGIEVLMIRRHETASFVPDTWVFPGGMLDELDRDIAREQEESPLLGSMRVAAVRELFEETGVWLGGPLADAGTKRRRLLAGNLGFRSILNESPVDFRSLVWTSHWITPAGIPKRFDTYFFVVEAPPDADPVGNPEEAGEVGWFTPDAAIESLKMVFPTIRNLETLRGFRSAREAVDSRRGQEIPTMLPRIVDGRIVLP